ncbi:MAG TPA: hypothetical protein VN648_33330 [Candidatus Methylomirabilis sp.]|nr:hypothetical protein [Candidatus Methylomirabilis sp.]
MAKKGARQSRARTHKGGKKNRKHGRNKSWCEAYRQAGQRERNKRRRLARRVVRHPRDGAARSALARMGGGGDCCDAGEADILPPAARVLLDHRTEDAAWEGAPCMNDLTGAAQVAG